MVDRVAALSPSFFDDTLVDGELNFAYRLLDAKNEALVEAQVISASSKMSIDFLCAPVDENTAVTEALLDADIVVEVLYTQGVEEGTINLEEDEEEDEQAVDVVSAVQAVTALEGSRALCVSPPW